MKTGLYLLSLFVHTAFLTNEEKCFKPSSTLRHVQYCPETQEKWEKFSVRMNCSQYISRCPGYDEQVWEYHCVIDTHKTQLLEVCAPSVNVIGRYCAEFNIKGDIIQENVNAPCPPAIEECPFSYLSTTAYKFPGCFDLPFRKIMSTEKYTTISEASTTLDVSRSGGNAINDSVSTTVFIIVVSVLVVVIAIILTVWKSNLLEKISSQIGRRGQNFPDAKHKDVEQDHENLNLIPSSMTTPTDTETEGKVMRDVASMTEEDVHLFRPSHRVSLSLESAKSIKSVRTTASEVSRRSSLFIQECDIPEKHPQTTVAFAVGENYTKYGYSTPGNPSVITKTISYSRSEKISAIVSAILVDTNMKTVAFGNEAETAYYNTKLLSKNEFFFKSLLDLKRIDDNLYMRSVSRNYKSAKVVMSEYIKCLLSVTEVGGDTSDIRYIFTIPNSWDDSRRHLMEDAAVMAGIEKCNINVVKAVDTILPYVEAKKGYDIKNFSESMANIGKHEAFIVIHLGKARIEFVLLQLQDGTPKTRGTMSYHNKEWGEASIDNSCLKFLCKLFGFELISHLKEEHPLDFHLLLENFDRFNENAATSETGKNCLRLPQSFEQLVINERQLSIAEVIKASDEYKSSVKYVDGQLLLEKDLYHSFVKPSIDLLSQQLQQWFGVKKHSDASFLCITGGYSNCKFFQNVIESYFQDISIIIPHHPHIVTVEGAIRKLMS